MSSGEWVLHVCNNANQCAVILPIARELRDKYQIESRFLSLDRYYDQSVSQTLAQAEFEFAELPSRHCDGRFYDAIELRPAFSWEAAVEVHALFEECSPSLVLLGHDAEMVEQLIVREAERRGIPTARIQDGITGPIAPTTEPGLQSIHVVFEGCCDLLMTWNDTIRDNLIERSIPGEIATVGDPRTDVLLSWNSEASDQPPYTVLVIGQVWAKHRNMTFQDEVAMYERIISQFLSRGDTKVIFRPHPVQVHQEVFQQFPALFGDKVEVRKDDPLYELLKEVHVVVSVSSTVTVEAAMLGIPTFRLLHLLETDPERFTHFENKYLELLGSKEFPNVSYFERMSRDEFVTELAPVFDGKAAERAANRLFELLSFQPSATPKHPDVSVILIQGGGDIQGTIHSILRKQEFSQEILVCDTSAEGSLKPALSDFKDNPFVKYFHRPGSSSGAALNEMIAKAEAEVIARMSQGCIACPEWSQSLYRALLENPESRIALSEYAIRDDIGLLWKTQVLPESLNFEQLAKLETVTLCIQAYAFKKKHAVQVNEGDPNAEGALFSSLVADMQDARRIAIVRGRRFFTPFDPSKRTVAGPPAIPREPLFTSATTSNSGLSPEIAAPFASEASCSLLMIAPPLESLRHFQQRVLPKLLEEYSLDLQIVPRELEQEYREISHDIIRSSYGGYLGQLTSANFAEMCNAALQRARGESVLIVHPDVELSVASVRAHLSAHKNGRESAFIMGGLELHPELKDTFTGVLFRAGLLFGEAVRVHPGALGVEQVRTMNLSVNRELFLQKEFAFDTRFLQDWGRDFWFAHEVVEKGINVHGFAGDSVLYKRDWGLLEFLRHEQSRAKDMIRFMNRRPEFARTFLSIPAITSSEIGKWESGVLESLEELPEIFEQVFVALERIKTSGSLGAELESELVSVIEHLVQIVCVRELVRHYSNISTFAEVEINGELL